jgi:hypothetical protein
VATEATQMDATVNSTTAQIPQLPNHKVKIKMPLQRACNEKDEKGKLCGGHLKRWFYTFDTVERACGDVERAWGKHAEIYRCGHCKTVYLPSPAEPKGKNVGGIGQITIVGLPTGKDEKPAVEGEKKA